MAIFTKIELFFSLQLRHQKFNIKLNEATRNF